MQHKVCSHYSSKAAQHTFSLMSDGLPRVQQQARQYTVLPRNVLQCCFHAIVIHHAFPKLKFDMKESLCWEHLVRLKKVYRMLHAWQVYPSYMCQHPQMNYTANCILFTEFWTLSSYILPIRVNSHRWIILKSVSFLQNVTRLAGISFLYAYWWIILQSVSILPWLYPTLLYSLLFKDALHTKEQATILLLK